MAGLRDEEDDLREECAALREDLDKMFAINSDIFAASEGRARAAFAAGCASATAAAVLAIVLARWMGWLI